MIYAAIGIVLGISFILVQFFLYSAWMKPNPTSTTDQNNPKTAFFEELDKNGPYPTMPGRELIQAEALLTLHSIISKHAYKKFYPVK